MHTKNLADQPILKSIITLSIPIVLANLLQSGYQLTDAFWVGRLGGAAVAAVSISFPITFLLISLGSGFAVAGSTLIAQYRGAKNEKMVNHVASQTLLMVVIVSALLGSVGYLMAPTILKWMHVEPEVYTNALSFMRVSFVGIIFVFGFAMFQSVMRGIGEVKMPLYIVLGTVLLNFILDPLFIFGWHWVSPHGVAGAALATLGTQSIAMLVGLYFLLGGKFGIHLHLQDFKPDWAYIKRAFTLGFPASIEMSTRALGLAVMTFLISSFGTLTVAAYGVGSNVFQFVMILGMGLAMSTATLVGQNIGAKNTQKAEKIAWISSLIGFVALTAFGGIAVLFAHQIISFFVPNDAAVISEGTRYILYAGFGFGFLGVQMALIGALRAAGSMITTMVLSIVSQWVIQFPLAYVLSKHTDLGVTGLWLSFPLSLALSAIMVIAVFKRGTWKKINLTYAEKQVEQVTEEVLIEEGGLNRG